MNDPAHAVQIWKIRPEVFRFENPMTQVVGFWPKIPRPGASGFQIEEGHALQIHNVIHDNNKQQQNSMSWMVTQLYSDVASRPALGRVPPWPDYNRLARARA